MDGEHRAARMNPNRRRKKRPSYGVRTVEIARGRHGFGFTISGQAPCILSSIVNGSPADRAGLRTGDYLIAVDGRNVSKALHDDVVRTIGSCQGLLKIQIAENYYSNSSDDDDDDDDDAMPMARPRPKYPHRFRHKHNQQGAARLPVTSGDGAPFGELLCPAPTWRRHRSTVENTDRQLHERDYMNVSNVSIRPCVTNDAPPKLRSVDDCRYFSKYSVEPLSTPLSAKVFPLVAKVDRRQKLVRKEFVPASWGDDVFEKENHRPVYVAKGNQCRQRSRSCSPLQDHLQDGAWLEIPILKAVVGYLGTIEMPKEPQVSGRRLSAIHSCIRRLRVEKKVHTLVLLKVFSNSVTLTDSNGDKLAEYPTASIAFCGAYADDKRFFGLVTARTENSAVEQLADGSSLYSSSCHVFMADGKLVRHEDHARRALSFHLECTHADPTCNGRAECTEFPDTVDTILLAIVGLYRGRCGIPMDLDANVSPQPSHTSSNSDSGIGFRDEGQNSDRVSVADADPEYGVLPQAAAHVCDNSTKSAVRSRAGSCGGTVQLTKPSFGEKLAVRAMPDPIGFAEENTSFNTERLDAEQEPSKVRLRVQKYFQRRLAEQEHGKLSVSSRNYENHSYEPPQPPRSMCAIALQSISVDTLTTDGPAASRDPPADNDQDADEDPPSFSDDITENTCEQEGSQDVHPPTQGEESDSSTPDNDDTSPEDDDVGQRWSRGGSFRKRFRIPFGQPCKHLDSTNFSGGHHANRRTFDDASLAGMDNDEDNDSSRANGHGGGLMTVGRVGSWAITFEKLLADPAGLHTFAEFLKKEFSCENIMFWVACERYRKSAEKSQMKELARDIFDRHLGVGASEPVNVDSRARQLTEDGLDKPDRNLFAQAQKQIYNLMKFDCYARFLKSPLYRDCMLKEVAGELLPYLGADEFDPEIPFSGKLKDKKEKGEDRRRKSLLPWHRTKSNKLKKEKSKKSFKKDNTTMGSSWSDLTGSRSSLASSDVLPSQNPLSTTESVASVMSSGDEQFLCKLHLPDGSTTVVPIKSGECVSNWLRHLLERRGIDPLGVSLRFVGDDSVVDLASNSSLLSGCEVRVEERPGDVCPRRLKPSLNELTSKVFDDLLRGRRSSVEGGQLLRKISGPSKPPIAARPLNLQPRKNSDEMYDLWKRTQCSRLDDQRGTEINFELPDFLKMRPEDGERRHYMDGRASEPMPSRSNNRDDSSKPRASAKSREKESNCLLVGGIIPTQDEADNYFHSKSGSLVGHNLRDIRSGPSNSNNNNNNLQPPRYSLMRPCSHPPPKGPAPWMRSASVPVCDFSNVEVMMAALSPVKEAPAATTFSMMGKSMMPSSVPLPVTETSINGEVADFSPPSPLDANVMGVQTTPPPPLPPKPRLAPRGPVPPAPDDKVSELANCDVQQPSQQRLLTSGKRVLKEHFHSDKFSISFV